ncbi:hypothetical protein [Aquimarina celericrescens]|uniref:Insecticidal crystal toxin domain-containing protein n=1 Tax=Aquimarina celericrescens TaxID=1964542 RepID=A0ABW5AV29_9FLAO|nr:hypothetical protein [Aquimarina celericrescens]
MDFDGLKIPLSLSYHASGIKVSQESSWVGLGWSLTSNAIITRSINQVSDIGSRKRVSANRIGDYGYAFEQEIPDTYNSAYEEYLESHFGVLNIDTQPDIFVANLFGRTVKFILTQKDSDPSPIPSERRIKVQLLDEGNEKIWYNDYSKNFTLTDDRGFTYYFDKKEYSTNVFREKPDELFYDEYCDGCLQFSFERDVHIITAWYVTKIISPHGKTLDFNYYLDGEENSYFISISQPTHNQTRTDTQCFVGQNDGSAKFESLNSPIQTVQEIVYLKDITDLSNGNRIVFKLSDREDLIDSETWNGGPGATCKLPGSVYSCISTGTKSPKKLSEIQIINSRGKIKKRVNFNYNYFNSDKINDVRKQSYLRLKLDGINVDDQEYKFVYNQPNSLPKKTSKDVDFFGFYNGANNQFI